MIGKLLKFCLPRTLWGDRQFGAYRFYKRLKRFPERRPIRFNDHLFVLKTSGFCYDPLIQFVTDKEYAKLYIALAVGKQYTIETYHILRNREELNEFSPDRCPCVLKPTHSSGQAVVCTNSSTSLDRDALGKWFDINRYDLSREQNYRYLIPKIIVEQFFSEDGHTVPKDYKFFCFRGVPEIIQVDTDRFSNQFQNFYDTGWNRIPVVALYPGKEQDDDKPVLLDRMLDLARQLSAPFPFVRVDMYATTTEIRIGELTFSPWSASHPLQPPEADVAWGVYFRDDAKP